MFSALFIFWCLPACSVGTRIGFLERPQNSVANPGDTVYFNCKTNVSDDTIQWTHDGTPISSSEFPTYTLSKNYLSFELGEHKDSYSNQIGEYQCIGRESLSTPPALLSIAELGDFVSSPNATVSVFEHNDILIDCEVPFSNPPGFVQYYKDNVYLEDEVLINGEILLIKNASTMIHDGQYSCSVKNHITREKKYSMSYVELRVLSSKGVRNKSQIIHHPKAEYEVNLGDNITIPCAASGSPTPTISWSRFGDSTSTLPSSHGLLEISNASRQDDGDYMCIVDGGARQFLRKTRVIVNTPPVFLEKPLPHTTLYDGESLSLDCRGSGVPLPEVRWYHNGLLLKDQKTHRLSIHSVHKKHSGYYQCFIINRVGSNYSVTFLRVSSKQDPGDEYDEDYEEYSLEGAEDIDASTLLPPSKPNITQLSPDSAMISWDIDSHASLSISFFKIQYREFHGRKRSDWKTLDEVIDPGKRNFEVIGLHSDRKYRFRIVAVYVNNDNKPGPLSKKFKFNKKLLRSRKPKIAPVITNILPMSETSLRLAWKMRSLADIEGYFILVRASFSKGRPFKKITIIGGSSHSFVIEDLQPGLKYEMRVQAFNFAGVSPLSKTVRRSTSPRLPKSSPPPEKDGDKGNDLMEHQVRLYLLIGGGLGLLLLLVIICYSINSYLQKRRALKTYSDANVAIHEKYMDASLSQFRSAVITRQSPNDESIHSSAQNIPPAAPTMETSFSNKASMNSSTSEITSRSKELGFEEYTAEPSGLTWKRKRRSEEIL